MHKEVECIACDAKFQAEFMEWAESLLPSRRVSGFNGSRYYDQNGKEFTDDEVAKEHQQVGGIGTWGMCPRCCERIWRAEERAREYMSPCEPEWFDEGYAGERWNDDY